MLPAASSFMLRISFLLGPEARVSWATLARHWESQSSSAEMYSWHWQLWERTGSVSGSVRPRGPLQRDVSCLSWGRAFRGEPEVTGPHTLMPCSCTGWGISQDESHAWDENVLGVGWGKAQHFGLASCREEGCESQRFSQNSLVYLPLHCQLHPVQRSAGSLELGAKLGPP